MNNVRVTVRLLIAVVFVLSATGCGVFDESEGVGGEIVPEDLGERCEAACERVYGERDDDADDDGPCQQSFSHDDGSHMSEDDCVVACEEEELMEESPWCVATKAECESDPADMVYACETGVYDEDNELYPQCEAACARVYGERDSDLGDEGPCQQSFESPGGGVMSEDDCVDACHNDDLMRGSPECVAGEAECGTNPEEMVVECISDDYHPPACDHLDPWDLNAIEQEEEVLEEVNELRAEGPTCPTTGTEHQPADPVVMDENLRCASRLHSIDMVEQDFFEHTNPNTNEGPQDRADAAGYEGWVSENIAFGSSTGEATVQQWLGSADGHCENMLDPSHEVMGIGMYENHWTQKFGNQ